MSLSESVTSEVGKVIGDMAVFFVRKQCRDIGINVDTLEHKDLPILADRLEKAVKNFTTGDVAHQLRNDILSIGAS